MHQPPGAWIGYCVYCVLKVAFYSGLIVVGTLLNLGRADFIVSPLRDFGEPSTLGPLLGKMMIATGAPLVILYVVLPFLPRKPWAYWTHFSAILTGILMCLFAPICIPLAFTFMRPQVKNWFGIPSSSGGKPKFEI